ncbi:MAG: MMPL family transporter, partial [Planctomycetia bacterium]
RTALAILLASAALAAVGAVGLRFKTDRFDLLDPTDPAVVDWRRYQKGFVDDADVVVAAVGDDRAAVVAALDDLADELKARPKIFQRVFHRVDADRLKAKGLYQLPLAELRDVAKRLELLQLTTGALGWGVLNTEAMLRQAVAQRSAALADPADAKPRTHLADLVALVESLKAASPPAAPKESEANLAASAGPTYFFSPDGRTAVLRTLPAWNGEVFVGYEAAVREIRTILAAMKPKHPTVAFGLTGIPVLEDDEMQAAQTQSLYSFLLAAVGVGMLCMVGYKSIRHPLLALAGLLVGTAWTMGWIALTVGHLNILSMSFLITLIGLGVDYGIYWLARYESERTGGLNRRDANQAVAATVGPGIVVGALTTALAFYASAANPFLGLREMGWIAGAGIVFCLVAAVSVLPVLLTLFGRNTWKTGDAALGDAVAFPALHRQPGWTAGVCLGVAGLFVAAAPFVPTDYNLLHLQPRNLPSVQWEQTLLREMKTSAWYALSVADTKAQALDRKAKFEKLPTVGRVVEAASLLPDDADLKRPVVESLHRWLATAPLDALAEKAAPPNSATVLPMLQTLAEDGRAASAENQRLLDRLAVAAKSAVGSLSALPPADRAARLNEHQRRWLGETAAQLRRLRDSSDPTPPTLADLPTELRERYCGANGEWLVQVFAADSVWDLDPLRKFAAEVRTVDPRVTGKPISGLAGVEQMAAGYARTGVLAAVVILLAVWFDLRRWGYVVAALTPLVLGVSAMHGVMAVTGLALNPANLLALPLIIGIGVDHGVHIVHDFRHGPRPYYLKWNLARALLLTSSTTVIGFLSLCVVDHWGMVSLGLALAIGVTTCTFFSMVLLPAVLHLATAPRTRPAAATPADDDALADGVEAAA